MAYITSIIQEELWFGAQLDAIFRDSNDDPRSLFLFPFFFFFDISLLSFGLILRQTSSV